MLLTRSPLYSGSRRCPFSFDLHVLGTPPALILSQDQTLRFFSLNSKLTGCFCLVVKEHGFSADFQPPPTGIIAQDWSSCKRERLNSLPDHALWAGVGFLEVFLSFGLGTIVVHFGVDGFLVLGKGTLPLT